MGVVWAWRWKPAPSLAPPGWCGRVGVPVVVGPCCRDHRWLRWAGCVGVRPAGRFPPGARPGRAGNLRRFPGTGCLFVGPLLVRSRVWCWTWLAWSRVSTTVRITRVPLVRSRRVVCWWVRPRAPMRCQAALSRPVLYPHASLGQVAHAQPARGSSGARWWRTAVRQCGQYFDVPRGGTITTAMPWAAAVCRTWLTIAPRTVCDRRVFRVRPLPRASMSRRSSR